jgi:rhodanese-related sulfurtransferase
MSLWKRVQAIFSSSRKDSSPPLRVPAEEDAEEIVVPEITVELLRAAMAETDPPLVIDVREPYEWRLVRVAWARHIPMNSVPAELESLDRDRPLVVMCAHGSRSYSVAAWLIEQGYDASSLSGGITAWAAGGGEVEQG